MSRDRSPSGTRMRFTCDPCGVLALAVPLGQVPRGWRCEPARDVCHLCVANEVARPWPVTLPPGLRALFQALAEANGTSAEEQLVRYLEADLGLVDLAADAARRVQGRTA